jgi:hypothetical protein
MIKLRVYFKKADSSFKKETGRSRTRSQPPFGKSHESAEDRTKPFTTRLASRQVVPPPIEPGPSRRGLRSGIVSCPAAPIQDTAGCHSRTANLQNLTGRLMFAMVNCMDGLCDRDDPSSGTPRLGKPGAGEPLEPCHAGRPPSSTRHARPVLSIGACNRKLAMRRWRYWRWMILTIELCFCTRTETGTRCVARRGREGGIEGPRDG